MLRHHSLLRLPEGRWTVTERRASTNFVADLRVELCIAGEELVLFNTQQLVHICRPQALAVRRPPLPAAAERRLQSSTL